MKTNGAQFQILKHFTWADGANPAAGLIVSGNVCFGTTSLGGNEGAGTVFSVGTNGTGYTVLKHFGADSGDGKYPQADLILFNDVLYGTTQGGSELSYGTVFKIRTDGSGYMVLKKFNRTDGSSPGATTTTSSSGTAASTAAAHPWTVELGVRYSSKGIGRNTIRIEGPFYWNGCCESLAVGFGTPTRGTVHSAWIR